jgi:hypothetical protein
LAKEAREAEGLAAAEAKEESKSKAASQALYNALWNAHEGLAAAVDKITLHSFHTEAYTRATEKVAEGEALIEQSLDALKMKINGPIATIKAYIQSLKPILSEAQKRGGQKMFKETRETA